MTDARAPAEKLGRVYFATQTNTYNTMAKQQFDTKSAGFIYSVTAFFLTILAMLGVGFSEPISQISGQLETSIQGANYFGLVALVGGSVLFPIWNLIQKKQKLNWKNLVSSTANIIALVNAALGLIALTGFVLPAGTVEQIVAAVQVKDWAALAAILINVVIPTIVRFIKDKKAATV